MKKYTIDIDRVEHGFIEVEARNEAEAIKKATTILENGEGFIINKSNDTIIKVVNQIK